MKKDIILGVLVGILANIVGIILYILAFSEKSLEATIRQSLEEGFFGKIVTLGAILNLLAFFYFIRKKHDSKARGVLLATVIIAIVVMIRKFS